MITHTVLSKKEYLSDSGELKERYYHVGYAKETERGANYLTLFQFPDTTFLLVPPNGKDPVIHLD